MKKIMTLALCAVLALGVFTGCGKKSPQETAALDLINQVISGDLSALKNCEGYTSVPEDLDIFGDLIQTMRQKTKLKVLKTTDNQDGTYTIALGADSPDLLKAYSDLSIEWLNKAIEDSSLSDADIQKGILDDLKKTTTTANWKIEIVATVSGEKVTLDVSNAMDSINAVYTCNLYSLMK